MKRDGLDRPRLTRITDEWLVATNEMVADQASDETYTSPEALLTATAETFEDIKAMEGLKEYLERDCE
jgi:hypothetical protein